MSYPTFIAGIVLTTVTISTANLILDSDKDPVIDPITVYQDPIGFLPTPFHTPYDVIVPVIVNNKVPPPGIIPKDALEEDQIGVF